MDQDSFYQCVKDDEELLKSGLLKSLSGKSHDHYYNTTIFEYYGGPITFEDARHFLYWITF